MRMMTTNLRKLASSLWNYLKEVSGENDYAHYKSRVEARGGRPVTAREFYRERQQQKYARPNRCC
jgi:uncharacterized short protein YbdD (DUF466 family)